MALLENTTKRDKNINQDMFLTLLKNSKIEEAIERYIGAYILIDYNLKKRFVPKQIWIKYLKRTILNKFTEVVQFKVEKAANQDGLSTFKIFMICKKINGTFDFTEISVNNNWEDNYINKMQYELINH